jgi:phage tail-like protein
MSGPFDAPADTGLRYLLEIESLIAGVFREARGLESKREMLELDVGGLEHARKLLGPYAQGTFYLSEGETDEPFLYDWWKKSEGGSVFSSARRTGNVILVDASGEERMRWRFRLALLTDWEGPESRPEPPGSRYEIARLGVAHEGLELVPRR